MAQRPLGVGRPANLAALVPALVHTLLLAVLSMHQLSRNHALVLPAADTGHALSSLLVPQRANHSGPPAAAGSAAHADTCCTGGRSDHAALWAACILALTLLVGNWWLRRPGRHPQPAGPPRRAEQTPPAGRRIPCLSLVELSLRRT